MKSKNKGGIVDLSDLKDNFKLEVVELLDDAEDALLAYDNGGPFEESYNKIFRSFHSLKGAAGIFGLDVLQAHMHKLETLLDRIKEKFPNGAVDYFLAGIDGARAYFDSDTIEFDYVDSFDGEVKVATPEKTKEERRSTPVDDKDTIEIFVVDDEEVIVDLIAEPLEENGYIVKKFYDGKEVLEVIDTHVPDLIISDIKMPIVDGISMVKELTIQGYKIPVVFVSGFVTKQAILNGLQSGAIYFIEKPFKEEYLLSLVATLSENIKRKKLLSKTIDYIIYQFASNEEILKEAGKINELNLMKSEIEKLLSLR
jgi:CheY-like chemotaxis protein/HPt (histidine-containing phosphotransfer) domain-containing protein